MTGEDSQQQDAPSTSNAPQHEEEMAQETSRSSSRRRLVEDPQQQSTSRTRSDIDEGEAQPEKPRSPKSIVKDRVPKSPFPTELPDLEKSISSPTASDMDVTPLSSPASSHRSSKSVSRSKSSRSNRSKSPRNDSSNRRSSTSNRRHSSRESSSTGFSTPKSSRRKTSQGVSTSPKGRSSGTRSSASGKVRSPRTPGSSPHGKSRRRSSAEARERIRSPRLMDDDDSRPSNGSTSSVMGGILEGKQMDILEDNPRGHAEEKLHIVPGIETLSVESNCSSDSSAEESDIIDSNPTSPAAEIPSITANSASYEDMPQLAGDGDDEEEDVADRSQETSTMEARVQPTLPKDPAEGGVSKSPQQRRNPMSDRFDPSYKNNDLWAHGGDKNVSSGEAPPPVTPTSSSDNRKKLRSSDHKRRSHHSPRAKQSSPRPSRKSTSGRKTEKKTEEEVAEDDEIEDEDNLTSLASLPDYASDKVKSPKQKSSSRHKKKPHAETVESPRQRRHSTGNEHGSVKSSNDRSEKSDKTGKRQSHRNSGRRNSLDRVADYSSPRKVDGKAAIHQHSHLPTSPKSNSWVGAVRQEEALNALRLRAQTGNKPLGAHVGREDQSADTDDDYTLGASTISTNFTTTQRSRDDTVSVRSLFQPTSNDRTKIAQELQPPKRRTGSYRSEEDGISEEDEKELSFRLEERISLTGEPDASFRSGHGSRAGSVASQLSQEINHNFEFLNNASDHGNSLRNSFERSAPVRKPSGDDILEMSGALERGLGSGSPKKPGDRKVRSQSAQVTGSTSADATLDSNSTDSDFMKWQEENAHNIVDDMQNDGNSVAFLQLKPESSAVTANVTPAADLDSPLQPDKERIASSDDAIEEIAAVQFDAPDDIGEDKVPRQEDSSAAVSPRKSEFLQFNGGVIPRPSPMKSPAKSPSATAAKLFRKPKIKLFGRKSLKGAVALEDEEESEFDLEEEGLP